MSGVRRAFAMASAEQYLAMLINFAMLTVLARLLTPSEVGTAIIGMSISLVVFSLRTFVTPEFLIQRSSINGRDIRTAFTLQLCVTVLLATALLATADWMARFYRTPELSLFLKLCTLAAVIEIAAQPIVAILSREMAFGTLARIRTASSAAAATVTIVFAWLGHSYMSYAWGLLAGAVMLAGATYMARPAEWSFRPCFSAWREAVAFGRFKGATIVVERFYEAVPQLLLGRIMPTAALGLYNRANAVCGIPDRMLLSAVFAMAFPALAAQVRAGADIKCAFLRILNYITVFYWPALVVLAITADSVVHIILGKNWSEAAPLVRILALASLFWFPVVPTNPLLLALGENREAFTSTLIARSIAAVVLCSASLFGLFALALSQFVAIPLQMYIALHYARRHVGFTWREFAGALLPSLIVTICAGAGPLIFAVFSGWQEAPFATLTVAGCLAAAGWTVGLIAINHSFIDEIRAFQPTLRKALDSLPGRRGARRVVRLRSQREGGQA